LKGNVQTQRRKPRSNPPTQIRTRNNRQEAQKIADHEIAREEAVKQAQKAEAVTA